MRQFKCKIKIPEHITAGPTNPDELMAMVTAKTLMDQGYRKTSNAYCLVSKIDRDDWVEFLAKERRCSVAHFYNVDGSGISDSHRDYYVRVHSKDKQTVHPLVLSFMKAY
jgi:hypothetical protein